MYVRQHLETCQEVSFWINFSGKIRLKALHTCHDPLFMSEKDCPWYIVGMHDPLGKVLSFTECEPLAHSALSSFT